MPLSQPIIKHVGRGGGVSALCQPNVKTCIKLFGNSVQVTDYEFQENIFQGQK